MRRFAHGCARAGLATLVALGLLITPAPAQNIPAASTRPTKPPGNDQPNQFIHVPPKSIAQNMEPVIEHPEQAKAAAEKLAAAARKFGRKPNILIFLLDDVGWMDPGFNGGGVAVGNPTPQVDRVAHDGLILTSAYSTPSCSPTRATIMTGQNPLHHGLLRPPMYGEKGGLAGAVPLATILQKLGDYTQGVGKWHMGENDGSQPQNVGFDDFYGFLGVSDMYTEWRDTYFNPEVALGPARFKMMEKLGFNHYNVHCTPDRGLENTYLIDLDKIKDLDQDWAAYSERFIRRMDNAQKPWFLYHCTRACHFDNYPNDHYAGKSPARTVFSDGMVEIDDVFGRLVKALEETGQLENTIIFFTSDNGPEQEVPPHGRTPFRGAKGSSWEGGVRVPTFVYWKGVIEPRKSDGLFDLGDLFNTFASIAGAPGAEVARFLPKDRYVDGIDQTSFWLAPSGESCRRSRIYTMNQFVSALRMDEFKAHITVQLQDAIFERGFTGGFSGAMVEKTGGATVTNLYTNPQEDVSIGIRHIPITIPLMGEGARYAEVLKKYPPRIKIGFVGN